MNPVQLLHNMQAGDVTAARDLLELQRQDRGLRLYPFGRSGPDDDGVGPVLLGLNADGLVRVEVSRPGPLRLFREDLGKVALHQMNACAAMVNRFGHLDEPERAMEEGVTPEFGFTLRPTLLGADLTLFPSDRLEWDYGFYHARKIADAIVTVIEQHEWEPEDCGFTEDQYYEVLMFAVDDPG